MHEDLFFQLKFKIKSCLLFKCHTFAAFLFFKAIVDEVENHCGSSLPCSLECTTDDMFCVNEQNQSPFCTLLNHILPVSGT